MSFIDVPVFHFSMTTKMILAITLAAVVAIGVPSAMAALTFADFDQVTPLKKTHLSIDDDGYNKILFSLNGKANTGDVFGGYAVITDGHVIAVTSHPQFYDSVVQGEPDEGPAVPDPFGGVAQYCTATDLANGNCGEEWHVHLVEPVGDTRCATGLAVGDLSFEEPNMKTKQVLRWIMLKGTPFGEQLLTGAASGTMDKPFTVGLPSDAVLGDSQYSLAFDLNPIVEDPAGITGICIGPSL